jgi:hypothetical protein
LEVEEKIAGKLLLHISHQGQDRIVGRQQPLEIGVFFRQGRLDIAPAFFCKSLPYAFQVRVLLGR